MKKLILLLFIPIMFTCSSDDTDDDSSETNSESFREYLNTNVFILEGLSNEDNIDYPYEEFIRFNLIDGLGSSWCTALFSESPNLNGTSNEPWNEYILQWMSCESYIYQEFENEIFTEVPTCGPNSDIRYSISRNGDDITLLQLGNPYSLTYTISTYDYLQERKNDYNNNYSFNSDISGDCY